MSEDKAPTPKPLSEAEELARSFHTLYEHLASDYGYETRLETRVEWEQVPENNKGLMIEVCERILAVRQPTIRALQAEAARLREASCLALRWFQERDQPAIQCPVHKVRETLQAALSSTAGAEFLERVKGIEAALEETKAYFDQRADVHHDNPHAPNEEMRLWEEINTALERR